MKQVKGKCLCEYSIKSGKTESIKGVDKRNNHIIRLM